MEPTPPPPPPFSPAPHAAPPPQAAPGWWSRNWKWFVPTGCCLGSLVVCVLVAAIFGLGVFGAIFGMMKSSEPYKVALARAKANQQVISALGTPITEGFSTWGKVNIDGASGDADLSIPISGPKGKGTIYVTATKSGGEWTYSKLSVKVDSTGETIDLGP